MKSNTSYKKRLLFNDNESTSSYKTNSKIRTIENILKQQILEKNDINNNNDLNMTTYRNKKYKTLNVTSDIPLPRSNTSTLNNFNSPCNNTGFNTPNFISKRPLTPNIINDNRSNSYVVKEKYSLESDTNYNKLQSQLKEMEDHLKEMSYNKEYDSKGSKSFIIDNSLNKDLFVKGGNINHTYTNKFKYNNNSNYSNVSTTPKILHNKSQSSNVKRG